MILLAPVLTVLFTGHLHIAWEWFKWLCIVALTCGVLCVVAEDLSIDKEESTCN